MIAGRLVYMLPARRKVFAVAANLWDRAFELGTKLEAIRCNFPPSRPLISDGRSPSSDISLLRRLSAKEFRPLLVQHSQHSASELKAMELRQ